MAATDISDSISMTAIHMYLSTSMTAMDTHQTVYQWQLWTCMYGQYISNRYEQNTDSILKSTDRTQHIYGRYGHFSDNVFMVHTGCL